MGTLNVHKKRKTIQVKSASITNDCIVFKTSIKKFEVDPDEVIGIDLERVLSLVDEIGVFVEADNLYFLTDGYIGFHDVADVLQFSTKFGENWYEKVDAGDFLKWRRRYNDAEPET